MGHKPPLAPQKMIGETHRITTLDAARGWTRIRWALRKQNGTLTHGRVD
jgi:hypothetical protein